MTAFASARRSIRRRMLVVLLTVGVLGVSVPAAQAAFGDDFGINDVNVPGAPTAPAFPGTSAFWAGTCDTATAPIGPIPGGVGSRPDKVWEPIGGGSSGTQQVNAPEFPDHCIDVGRIRAGDATLWEEPPAWRLAPVNQAGAHPDGTATMWFRRAADKPNAPDGAVDNIHAELPAGFVGDPTATPRCTQEQFAHRPVRCGPETQIGVINLYLTGVPYGVGGVANYGSSNEERLPVYNLEPRHGNTAEFGFHNASDADATTVRITAKARTNSDFGVTAFATQIPAALPLLAQSITLWGTPWAASHDLWRAPQGFRASDYPADISPSRQAGEIPAGGLPASLQRSYDPSWGPIKPFLSNPTECSGSELTTGLSTDSFEHPGAMFDGFPDLSDPDWRHYESPAPPITGCEKVPFDPAASFQPSSKAADGPSGLNADITVPPNDEPPADVATDPDDATGAPAHWKSDAGLATSHLDKTVVKLPEGMSVNPSAAAGLEGCSDAQMGVRADGNPKLFNNSEPACPDGSKIGTAEATTPLLEGSPNLTGDVVLGTPTSIDPQSGEMFRLFLVLRNKDRGLLAKIYGSAVADPKTGQLTATFDKNPRVPVENIKVNLKGGDRGLFGNPQSCGAKTTASTFSPWSAAHGAGGSVKSLADSFTVAGDCAGRFTPAVQSGMSNQRARGTGTFNFTFTRGDGEQWIDKLTATLPTGLLASVKNVPLCKSAQAAAGTCDPGSRIGTVDAAAGSGTPYVLEKKGTAYLTEGYKGCAYGLSVVVPVEAGPFKGNLALSPIVVRQALCVDPTDAHVTAVSDPLPITHHGIPLRVRSVTVSVDRSRFMLNPSSCKAKRVSAVFGSPAGAGALAGTPFQAVACGSLPYKPKIGIALTNKTQTKDGEHPGVNATVTQAPGEAGIKKAKVSLPLALALDPDNAQALCEYEDGLKINCPKTSIVGRATAESPLLNRPLTGPVYFVKNVRINKFGRRVRTLPTLLVTLRGEIAVNLRATSDVDKQNRLVNTFDDVPDAPISRFRLNINGGKNGILVVTGKQDICKRLDAAEAETDAQSGRTRDFDIDLSTPCGLAVLSRSYSSKSVKLRIGGVGAGKVTVSGKGIKRTSKRLKSGASFTTVTAKLTKTGRRLRKRGKAVKVKVAYRPAGSKKTRVATSPKAKKKSAKKKTKG